MVRDEVLCCFNVPYAHPPLGRLRFREALPPEPWPGVRDGRAPGPIAPQPAAGFGGYVPGDPTEQDEDCLTLNVFSSLESGSGRAVAVFLHGGAFATGTGAGVMYDGERLAREGIVVVTLNYRLGALGFLAHPALADPTSGACGNWALSDVLAALAFVREHAVLFGGDGANVTLIGESSGAMLAADLLGAPRAAGTVSRAVLESGAVLVDELRSATDRAESLALLLGTGGVERDRLASVPVAELLAASATLTDSLGGALSMPFRPVLEPGILPVHPARAVAAGAASGTELLVGTNRDEFALFTLEMGPEYLDEGGRLGALTGRVLESVAPGSGERGAELVERYRALVAEGGGAKALFDRIATDVAFRIPALRLAEAQSPHGRVFCYRFDWPSPFMNGALGACHGIELPFVFGTLENPVIGVFAGTGPEASELSREVRRAWRCFAECGDPSGGALGRWPEYLPGRQTMLLRSEPGVVSAPEEATRQLWEAALSRYGDEGAFATGAAPGT